jgi:mannose-6-phosphate isomerase
LKPQKLTPVFHEKVWGATRLEPWFADRKEKTGEVWFTASERLPVLVKFLFTSGRLSVQVHPDDDYGRWHENSPGKTEMWHILRAEPGAAIAAGFREPLTRERLRKAIASGEIEKLIQWHPVNAGDTVFIPAGTVHAIGPGLALCEIQQYSDITYRLYDWNRPRELHIEKALEVADLGTHAGPQPPQGATLASCRYFETELLKWDRSLEYQPAGCFQVLIFLEGSGAIAGEPFGPGEAWAVNSECQPFCVAPAGNVKLLRASVPAQETREL